MDELRPIPLEGETGILDDTGTAGVLIRDGQVLIGSSGAALKLGDTATLLASLITLGSGSEIRLKGRVVVDGEIVPKDGNGTLTANGMYLRMAAQLRDTVLGRISNGS